MGCRERSLPDESFVGVQFSPNLAWLVEDGWPQEVCFAVLLGAINSDKIRCSWCTELVP